MYELYEMKINGDTQVVIEWILINYFYPTWLFSM